MRASNYTAAFAVDGADAIRVARVERPDLILLDPGLPAGCGLQVRERLARREQPPSHLLLCGVNRRGRASAGSIRIAKKSLLLGAWTD